MCVCVCVCVCVCHVCACVRVCVMYACVCACVRACMHACVCVSCMRVYVHACVCVMYVRVCACMHVCMADIEAMPVSYFSSSNCYLSTQMLRVQNGLCPRKRQVYRMSLSAILFDRWPGEHSVLGPLLRVPQPLLHESAPGGAPRW